MVIEWRKTRWSGIDDFGPSRMPFWFQGKPELLSLLPGVQGAGEGQEGRGARLMG